MLRFFDSLINFRPKIKGNRIKSIEQRRKASASVTRHCFHEECETALNEQINKEFAAGYLYFDMAHYFSKDTVALPGFHSMFSLNSIEEIEHGTNIMKYLTMRGGSLKLNTIQPPKSQEWDPTSAITASIEAEKFVLDSLLNVNKIAQEHHDYHLDDFIINNYLGEQYEAIQRLGYLLSQIKLVGDGNGLYLLDLQLLREYRNKLEKYK